MMNDDVHIIDWEQVSRYLSGEMSEKEIQDFENLIESNPHYAKIVSSSEKDLEKIRDFHNIEELFKTDSGWEKVVDRIEQNESTQVVRAINMSAWQIFSRVAAVLIIAMGIGWGSYQSYVKIISPYKTVKISSNDNNNVITLKDGSVVYIYGNSQLKYSRTFNRKERRVKLTGEAYFDIARDPEKPFIISINGAEVKVLGTSFNVNAKNDNVEVFVESGKVELSILDNPDKKIILKKGDFGTLLHDKKLDKGVLNDKNYLSWKTKQMIFREMNLKEVTKVLNRTYRVQIRFSDPEIMDLRLTSTFDHEPLEIILESLSQTFNLAYEQNGKEIVFRKNTEN